MNLQAKRFIGSVYLKDKKAVKSINDQSIVSEDPVSYALKLSDSGLDEIFVFDLSPSGNDALHEEALDVIKDICKAVDVPVTGAGNVKRMEDIKKLLYAGCKRACLNFEKEGNADILQEVSEKFGADKIVICFSKNGNLIKYTDQVEKFACETVLFTEDVKNATKPETDLPMVVLCNDSALSPDEVFLLNDSVDGITGNIVNDNASKVDSYKQNLIDKGIKICALDPAFTWENLKKNSDGMVPVIVQDYRTDQVLMLAYMNKEAYEKTLSTGKMTYFSRIRRQDAPKPPGSSRCRRYGRRGRG